MYRFYERRVGPQVVSTRHFDRWWKRERSQQPDLLTMRLEDFVNNPVSDEDFRTRFASLHVEFEALTTEAHKLEKVIAKNAREVVG